MTDTATAGSREPWTTDPALLRAGARPVPTATDNGRTAHRPWCCDCKTKHDPGDLDINGRCARCARAVITRAAAAARRADDAAAARRAAKVASRPATPVPQAKQSRPTARPSVVHRTSSPAGPARRRTTNPFDSRHGPRATTDTNRICRLYLQDLQSIPQIATTTGHTQNTVRRALLGAGIKLRDDRATRSGGSNRLTPTPAAVADVVRRYVNEKQPIAQIASAAGTDRRQITRILTEAGVTIRPGVHLAHTEPDATTQQAMVDRYLAGATLAQIAADYHVRNVYIAGLIRAAGHTIRPRGAAAAKTARIAELGTTTPEVRAWAIRHGHLKAGTSGQLPAAIIDAYAAAYARATAS